MKSGCLVVPVMAGALLVSGCATKGFVREELQKSEAKLEQQVGRVAGELSEEKGRVSGLAGQVTGLEGTTGEVIRRADQATGLAGQAASQAEAATGRAGQALATAETAGEQARQAVTQAEAATGRAGQALTKAEETDSRLTRLWSIRQHRRLADTVVVTFRFNKWQLDDRAQTTLLEVVRHLRDDPTLSVDLEGYTDNVGPVVYNVQLSQRRAEAVRRFLVEQGIDLHRIQSIGLADARPIAENKTRQGREQNRRVAIKLYVPAE